MVSPLVDSLLFLLSYRKSPQTKGEAMAQGMHLSEQFGRLPNFDGDTEFRLHRNRQKVVQLVNGQLMANQKSESSGLSSRSIENGLYGFAARPEWSMGSAEKVLAQSKANLAVLKSVGSSSSIHYPPSAAKITTSPLFRKEAWMEAQLLDRMKGLDAKLEALGPEIKSRKIILREQSFEKEVWTGLGGHGQTNLVRCHIYFFLTAEGKNGQVEVMEVFGGRGFVEDIFPTDEVVDFHFSRAYKRLKEKMEGAYSKPGKHTVILDPKLAGILAHEAIGHTTEADLVKGGSVAGQFLNKKVASDLVTLVDFAHSFDGKECPVPVYHDDECIEASDTMIIENGILKGFMNSRESSVEFDQPATGHARAWGFDDEPLIRMRNTAILPGKDKLEDMISSVDEGYYLIDHSNGQADSTSEFMFGVTMGYEIKNGQLGRALLDTTISGVAFDMLKSVSMISDEMRWVDSGTCGKKQPMYVGMGGPAIKCQITMGGRS